MQPITSKVPVPLILNVILKFNEMFHYDLYNRSSTKFIEMKNEVETEIENAYNKITSFLSVTIIGFRAGSIVCDSRLLFSNSSDQNVSSLKTILTEYAKRSGKFEVSKFENADDSGKDGDDGDDCDDGDDDDVILGLNWWQVGLVIAGVVIFALLIAIIVLCVSV